EQNHDRKSREAPVVIEPHQGIVVDDHEPRIESTDRPRELDPRDVVVAPEILVRSTEYDGDHAKHDQGRNRTAVELSRTQNADRGPRDLFVPLELRAGNPRVDPLAAAIDWLTGPDDARDVRREQTEIAGTIVVARLLRNGVHHEQEAAVFVGL